MKTAKNGFMKVMEMLAENSVCRIKDRFDKEDRGGGEKNKNIPVTHRTMEELK